MSERYWISGVQLGLVIKMYKAQRKALVNKIIDRQFIGSDLSEYSAELFGIGGKPTKKEKKEILRKLKEAKKKDD